MSEPLGSCHCAMALQIRAVRGDAEGEVRSELPKEFDFLSIESVYFLRIYREHPERSVLAPQGKSDRGCVAVLQCIGAPGSLARIRSDIPANLNGAGPRRGPR